MSCVHLYRAQNNNVVIITGTPSIGTDCCITFMLCIDCIFFVYFFVVNPQQVEIVIMSATVNSKIMYAELLLCVVCFVT